uniref:Uncharacterized protein n=1 Tax=Arundo donax TaxID=35708 RepID=A0A0A9ET72_ARUDO
MLVTVRWISAHQFGRGGERGSEREGEGRRERDG